MSAIIGLNTLLVLSYFHLAQVTETATSTTNQVDSAVQAAGEVTEKLNAPIALDGPINGSTDLVEPSIWTFLASPINLIMLSLMAFYLVVLLPQQRSMKKQQKALAGKLDQIKKNDRVVTTGGIHGVVVSTASESGTVTIRIDESSGAKMTVNRSTIQNITSEN